MWEPGCRGQKKVPDPQELDLQAIVICHMDPGNRNSGLCKSSQSSEKLSYYSANEVYLLPQKDTNEVQSGLRNPFETLLLLLFARLENLWEQYTGWSFLSDNSGKLWGELIVGFRNKFILKNRKWIYQTWQIWARTENLKAGIKCPGQLKSNIIQGEASRMERSGWRDQDEEIRMKKSGWRDQQKRGRCWKQHLCPCRRLHPGI